MAASLNVVTPGLHALARAQDEIHFPVPVMPVKLLASPSGCGVGEMRTPSAASTCPTSVAFADLAGTGHHAHETPRLLQAGRQESVKKSYE